MFFDKKGIQKNLAKQASICNSHCSLIDSDTLCECLFKINLGSIWQYERTTSSGGQFRRIS